MSDPSRTGGTFGPATRRVRGWAVNLVLLIGTLTVLGLVAEVITRLVADIEPPLGVRHPVVGGMYRPGFQGSVHSEESGREVFLRFNREGFRGEDLSYDRAPGARRVAVLGDSFIAGLACDEEDTAVERLERLLAASHPEADWEVMNFGVEGSSTGQQLALYRHVVARYRPDLVIGAYFVGNDFSDNSTRLSRFPRIYYELNEDGALVQLPFSAGRRRVSGWLNRNSRFYVWQKNALRRLRPARGGGNAVYTEDPGPEIEGVWELNARLIEALAREVEGDGGRFVLAVLPPAAQVYDDVWQARLEDAGERAAVLRRDHPDRRLAAIGREHGVAVVTMAEEFRATASGAASAAAREELLYYRGYGHFTPRGHALAAEVIHHFLTEGDGREILSDVLLGPPGPAATPPASHDSR